MDRGAKKCIAICYCPFEVKPRWSHADGTVGSYTASTIGLLRLRQGLLRLCSRSSTNEMVERRALRSRRGPLPSLSSVDESGGSWKGRVRPTDFQGQFCAKMHDIEPQPRRDPASLGDQWQALRKVVSRTASHQYCERLPRRRSPRQKGPDKKLLLWKFEPVAHVAKLCLQSWL